MVNAAKSRFGRFGALLLSAIWVASPGLATAGGSGHSVPILYSNLKLPNGNTAVVFANGTAQVFTKDHSKVATEILTPGPRYDGATTTQPQLPDKGHIIAQLMQQTQQPFAVNRVIVVYQSSVFASQDVVTVGKPALRAMRAAVSAHATSAMSVPQYTSDATVNRTLGTLGVDRSERLFRQLNRSVLSALGSQTSSNAPALNLSNAYLLHISAASVRQAVQTLAKLPQVAYVSPDWTVTPMHAAAVPLQSNAVQAAKQQALSMTLHPRRTMSSAIGLTQTFPGNYALMSSAQSMLNAPSIDAAAAYDEITSHFGQLPGQGEIITNVSLGDLDDASEAGNTSDPCANYAQYFGPTTEIIGGQRYLNLPSMPLIPTYTSDSSGNLNGTGSVCGLDPYLGEVGLDFSVMAPLPHDRQRASEQGSGLTDLLGIAPGASYRLIVPGSRSAAISDIDAALLGAAMQTPRPNVITASIGFGYDVYGFSGRYLEEDPLSHAIIASIVQAYHIVVCISAGDGTRTYTTVAIGPSGGSVPTNLIPPGGAATSLNDDALSTTPSQVSDSGSIDVGGTTLDDIFANPPQYATSPQAIAQHAYAETRWTGFTSFSSGFGSRVNVSAPSDNILSFEHVYGGADDAVQVVLEGGTSASAPETAAAAAVVLQVARLTNYPLNTPLAVRQLLAQTGSSVPNVNQADVNLAIGPQIDLRAAVEAMLSRPGASIGLLKPNAARVAVEQRIDYGDLNGAFLAATDPSNIDLSGGPRPGANWLSWITIAPDWEFLPKQAQYSLFVKGNPKNVIATTPWARVLPGAIFSAAKLNPISSSQQSVTLTYEALLGAKVLASVDVPLTFGPAPAKQDFMLAPQVPAVVTGTTIPVSYDLGNVGDLNNPQLVVSEPGRVDPDTGALFHPVYTVSLSQTKGTVQVPVSSLQGGGYGIGIVNNSTDFGTYYSNFAFTRVASASASRPSAPLLSLTGSTTGSAAGHYLEVPYGGSFQVQYDVSNVARATGAELEISAAGPGAWGNYNPFNNPNGTLRDQNGLDSGSVYYVPLSGTKGTVTVNSLTAGLYAALNHVVRVIPTSGGIPVGEGSDVSSVSMDGVFALDGGSANNGFGVDANGSDAFLTSGQQLADGEILTSLETFDQTTNHITQNVATGSSSLFYTMGWGIWGNDIGLFCDENTSTFASTCNLLNTVASGTIGNAWSPALPSSLNILEGAANTANVNAAFLGSQFTNGLQYELLTSNILNNTSALYPINPTGAISPSYWGIAENTNTNTAVLPYLDFAGNIFGPPTIVLANLSNGNLTEFTGQGSFFPFGVAVDSVSNKAAVPTLGDNGFTIYDLGNQTGTEVILPQCPRSLGDCNDPGLYPAADPLHSEFLVEQTGSPDLAANNNSLSEVLVYDENGNLLKAVERFSLWGTFVPVQDNNLQLNPNTRSGYLIGPGQQQLIPFKY